MMPGGKKMYVPGGHAPFDYSKLVNLTDLRNACADILSDLQMAIEAIDRADLSQSQLDHMKAAMILSGVEIKMTNFALEMRKQFLERS